MKAKTKKREEAVLFSTINNLENGSVVNSSPKPPCESSTLRKLLDSHLLLMVAVISMFVCVFMLAVYNNEGRRSWSATQVNRLAGDVMERNEVVHGNDDGYNDTSSIHSGHGGVDAGLPPLIFMAGAGTTGTRTVFAVLCSMGYSGVHWNQMCNAPVREKDVKDTGMRPRDRTAEWRHKTYTHDFTEGVMAHSTLTRLFTRICYNQREKGYWTQSGHMLDDDKDVLCTDDDDDNGVFICCCASILDELKQNVETVLRSGIQVLSDSPYPEMASYIMSEARKMGREVVIVMTTRDPSEWIVSRTTHKASTLVYRDKSIKYGELVAALEGGDMSAPPGSDISMNDVLRANRQIFQDAGHKQWYKNLPDAEILRIYQESGYVDSFDEYQRHMNTKATVILNLFDTEKRSSKKDILELLESALPKPITL